jgi:hypothetical protein
MRIIYSLFQTFKLDQINTPIISPISHSTSKLLASWPNISSWGNKKRKHGRYRENEMNEEGPYFIFDRYTNGEVDDYQKLNKKLQSVRDLIKGDKKFEDIYDQNSASSKLRSNNLL